MADTQAYKKLLLSSFMIILASQLLLLNLLTTRRRPKSVYRGLRLAELDVNTSETRRTFAEAQSRADSYNNTNSYWVKRVRESCASSNFSRTSFSNQEIRFFGLPGWVWMRSPSHQLFYCAAPKCSSTTWKTYIMEDEGRFWKGDVHKAATVLGLSVLAKAKKQEQNYLHLLDLYRPSNRLMIVRNPWARLVSAYQNKVVGEKWTLKHLCRAGGEYNEREPVTFEMFTECITRSDRRVMWNSHVHPYTSLCAICHMDYNIIVRLEDMDTAEPFILETLKFKSATKYKPPAKGVFSHRYSDFYINLTEEIISRLADIYKDDINLFGYPVSPFELKKHFEYR